MAKQPVEIVEQNPQGGGSFIRNADGSLVENADDAQKTPVAEAPAADIVKE